MNDNPRANGSRGRDPYAALRLIALIAAIAGVIVLAAAAFVLSYGGIHKIALSAGVSPSVARIFPVIFDAMLVVSCAAVVSLRSAGWWQRTYSWLSTLALLVVVAAADAAQATGTHIPRKPAAATVAVLPWALLLLAFTLLLSMLRQFRRTRAAAAESAAAIASTRPGLDILNPRAPVQQPAWPGPLPAQRGGPGPRGRLPRSRPGKWQPPRSRPAEAATSVPAREMAVASGPAREMAATSEPGRRRLRSPPMPPREAPASPASGSARERTPRTLDPPWRTASASRRAPDSASPAAPPGLPEPAGRAG